MTRVSNTVERILLLGLPVVLRVSHDEAAALVLGCRMMILRLSAFSGTAA
ncbi:hypothetical protein ACMGDM_19515 [Sphingomonas sp. DT-51]